MSDASLWSVVWLSLKVSGVAVLLSAVTGIPCGMGLAFAPPKCRAVLRPVLFTGMALPPVVVGLVLYLLLSRSGPLSFLGWLFTPQAMMAAQVILTFPFVAGITLTAVSSVPPELLLQMRGLGASVPQARRTILREARPGILLAVAAAFGRSISEVGAVLMVGGNIEGETRVLTTAIVLETSQGHFELAGALGVVLIGLALLANIFILRFQITHAATL